MWKGFRGLSLARPLKNHQIARPLRQVIHAHLRRAHLSPNQIEAVVGVVCPTIGPAINSAASVVAPAARTDRNPMSIFIVIPLRHCVISRRKP